jgi:hypothetical protein
MPKAASPVRLQEELMEAARVSGSVQHRSAAEQIDSEGNSVVGQFIDGEFVPAEAE